MNHMTCEFGLPSLLVFLIVSCLFSSLSFYKAKYFTDTVVFLIMSCSRKFKKSLCDVLYINPGKPTGFIVLMFNAG